MILIFSFDARLINIIEIHNFFQTFHTPSFGDEEFVDVPLLNQMQQQQQHHYPMEPQRQYQQDDTQTMDYPYTLWNPDSQQLYMNSNEFEVQTNNQMYYQDPMSISNNQPIQSQHNNVMMPPPQKSPQITSPMSFVGQSPHAYGENGTTSDDSDDSLVRGANKRPSPEPLSEKLSPTSKSAKVSAAKKPKVSRKRKKKDPNEPQKPVSAYALFFRDTQAAIKGQNPNASFGEVSTIVASMWDVLAPEHKDVYKKKTEAAKAIYLKTLAAYRASVVSKGTDLESPPPPQSQPIQSSPHSQMNNSVPKPHATSPQQISQGLPIQHSNQSQYMAAQQPQPQQQMQPQQQQPHPQHQPPQQQQQQMHNNYVPVQYSQQYKSPTQDYMQQQPMHQINNSNINQNHLGYGGYDHNHQQQQQHHHHQHQQQHHQQQQPIEMHNGLMDNNGYHMQQSMQNSHQQHTNSHQQHTTSHHIAAGADQMGATGIAPSPNNAYHHQSNMLQKCIRTGCTNQAITSPDWEDEYCSNECVINHCGDVFGNWIQKNGQQQQQQQTYSAVK